MGILRLAFYMLQVCFRVYLMAQKLTEWLSTLLYNRQSRTKLLNFFKVQESEVGKRISQLQKTPTQIVIAFQSDAEEKDIGEKQKKIAELIEWTIEWTSAKQLVIYFLSHKQHQLNDRIVKTVTGMSQYQVKSLKNDNLFELTAGYHSLEVKIESFSTYLSKSQFQSNKHKSPLILIFNKVKGLLGIPYPYLQSGEILFGNQLSEMGIIDFEEYLKNYSQIKQRGGK